MDALLLNDAPESLWRQFFERGVEEPAHLPVLERWKRVRRLGIPPEGPLEEAIVTAEVLARRRDENAELVAAARPTFQESAQLFAEHHFVLLLTDADGLVLLRAAGGDFVEEADAVRLIEGASWSESLRGTNAIGTALVEQRPVGVVGAAHYHRLNHTLACYASPVRAPDGRLLGAVDATSRDSAATRVITLAVCGVARSIEARIRERSALASFQPLVERIFEPAVIVSPSGEITCRNDPFLRWAHHPALEQAMRRRRLRPGEAEVETDEGLVTVRVEALASGHFLLIPRERPRDRPRVRALGVDRTDPFAAILGHDPALDEAKRRAARFAISELPVLLLAESGTGKELMARAIHQASARRAHAFVALNCGALSAHLLETELFGYSDGAFTGAVAGGKDGKLAAADGGTLFLDEIGEMPATLQAMLLRVLEHGTYYRVGEAEPRHVDLRLICATCRDLPAMVEDGRFRSDLYFRIRGACIGLPPLRERTDLAFLVEAFLAQLSGEQGRRVPRVSAEARARLRGHRWPGNVRELRSALAHALVLADDEIRPEHLPAEPDVPRDLIPTSREDAERKALLAALDASRGNLSDAARRLGVARSTLYRMMDRLRLARR